MTDRPEFLIKLLRCDRAPDEVIRRSAGGNGRDYLRRWFVIPHAREREKTWWLFKRGNVFLHNFNRSDDDSALHDHPWINISILLRGSYLEHTPKGVFLRKPGQIVFRKATAQHRVELLRDETEVGELLPVWTLFITGPKIRDWGFVCKRGWIPWWEFCLPANKGEVGAGCGDD
jgi:hypothetical protein